MDVAVLGPVLVDGEPAGLAHRDRVVLAALAARAGLPVPRDALADALWGEVVPDSAAKVIQGCVLRLRKVLGHAAIDTTPSGYALHLHSDALDTARFERLVAQARDRLGAGEPDRAEHLVEQALALWRGDPFAEVEDWEPARVEAQRLTELRLDAQDVHTQAALELGRHEEVLAEALSRAEQAPLRERRWELVALAQYRCGRQGDALAALTRAKTLLGAELGLDPGPGLVALERAILSQDPDLLTAPHPANASAACPYPGLLPFGLEDEASFFGRKADVAACLDRLDQTGVLTVLGPSGCGKSSLVRAGVAAALRRDGRRVVVVTPGPRPLDSMSAVVTGASQGMVLVVDQCEEGLGEDVDPREQAAWVSALVSHAARGQLVLALRSDRVGALAGYPTLSRLVEPGLYLLGAMGEAELRSAIEGPAAHAGLRLETGLTDLLVRDVRGEPGALPLLSHVLRQTWMRREGATLTVAGYQACGGVREAVAQSADGLYERLGPPQRAMLRDLMLRLVAVSPDGEPMRSRMRRSQVAPDPTRANLVEQLVAARLVSTDDQSVEIAHEALAREWPRLRAWLDEDTEGQQILRHLTVAADTWEAMGRPDSELYRGVRLERALEWQTGSTPVLSPVESQFLQVSRAVADADREAQRRQALRDRRSNRRLRVLLAATAALAIVAAVLGSLAVASARRAESQAVSADARRVGAEALTAPRADTSLLLGVAGMRLEHNSDSARSNLAAALTRSPMLLRTRRTPAAGSITVDPKSGRVALALTDGDLTVYEPRTLRLLSHTKSGGAGYAAAFSPDGSVIAAADSPYDWGTGPLAQPVHLIDPTGAPYPRQVAGAPDAFRSVWSVAFSSDGRRLAAPLVGDVFGPVHLVVWDLAKPAAPVSVMKPVGAYSSSVALSPDGRTLYATGDTFLRVFDVATGTQRAQHTGRQLGLGPLPTGELTWTPQVAMSPDGHTLAVTSRTEVALVDPSTLEGWARIPATGRVTSVAFSADSKRLVVAGDGVSVWDLDPHRPIPLVLAAQDDGHRPVQVFRALAWGGEVAALSPDGNTVYADGQQGQLLAWDLTGTAGFVTAHPAPALPDVAVGAQVSPDGRKVAYQLNNRSRLAVRDVATGALVVTRYPEDNDALGAWLTWRPDTRAVISATGNEYMTMRDTTTAELIQRRAVTGTTSSVVYTLDGRVVVGSDDGHMTVMDAKSLQMQTAPLEAFVTGSVQVLALDPARHAVGVEGLTGGVLVDYLSGHVLRKLTPWTFFAPDGTSTAVVDLNGAVGFKTGDGRHWVSEPDPSHAYGDVLSTYSHNGALFASSRAGQVGLWNARTGAFVGSVPATGQVAVGFTSDDHALVIAGLDGTVREWDLRPDAWIRTACNIAGRDLTSAEWNTILPGRSARHVCARTGS